MQAMRIFVFTRSLQFQRSRSMRHLMPIVTPRLILRPPTLGDLDSIQTAKEEAWPDLQRWMSWAFDNQRSRHAMEDSIRRVMDYQNQAGIALAGFHRINRDLVLRTALDLTDEQDVYETGYWVAPFATVLPSGDSGAVPVTAIMFPARTAREIPTFGSNGDPVETCWRLLVKAIAPFK